MPCASGRAAREICARYGRRADSDAMNQSSSRVLAGGLLRGTLRLLWHAVRLPVYMFLVILEPAVRFILGALALLGVLTALFFKSYGVPHFPFALILGVSVGCGLMLVGYDALLRLFGR